MSGTVHVERDGSVAVLVIDNPPVNAGSRSVRQALLAAIETVEADPAIIGAVLIGAGKTFIAGSDIKEFDLPLDPPQLPAVIAAIEGAGKPFVAALHGSALGGGYELALGCDARIAAPGTVLGLPESTLGIIPGAGGTQKLPRLVGIPAAIGLIASGRRVGADEALELGMIDAIAAGDLRAAAVAHVCALGGRKQRVIDRPVPEADAETISAAATKALSSGRNRPHIAAAIAHVRRAREAEPAAGLAAERAAFEQLRVSPEAKALRHIFFAEREAARGRPGRTAKPLQFARFGVLGAGTMGAGIATALLQAGFAVDLVDADAAALDRAGKRIAEALDKAVSTGRMSADAVAAARTRLMPGQSLAAFAQSDVLIEAIIEDLPAKQAVFAELDSIARPGALLATNTSYLDIDAIAAATRRPESVIGLHFFSPAHVMKLLEVVAGEASSDAAMATGLAVARALGKQPVEAGNGFGFIGNRIYSAYRQACEFMLEDGALPHEIDAALEAFGFAMGPFAVSDLSGLDIAWRMRQSQASTRDPEARYVVIADRLCEAGRFGRKTGAGFYRYDAAGRRQRDPDVDAIVLAASAEKGIARRAIGEQEIQRRALAALVNEAALVLAQGIAMRPGDIDVVLVNGYGFPRWTGGPLHWAMQQDADQLTADCAAFVSACRSGKEQADLDALAIVGR